MNAFRNLGKLKRNLIGELCSSITTRKAAGVGLSLSVLCHPMHWHLECNFICQLQPFSIFKKVRLPQPIHAFNSISSAFDFSISTPLYLTSFSVDRLNLWLFTKEKMCCATHVHTINVRKTDTVEFTSNCITFCFLLHHCIMIWSSLTTIFKNTFNLNSLPRIFQIQTTYLCEEFALHSICLTTWT